MAWHVASQLPEAGGSHVSPRPVSTTLSPQPGFVQFVRQAPGVVLLLLVPLSHCSPLSSTPLPQPVTFWQVLLHTSVFGGSHCSLPVMKPSPQNGASGTQVALQLAV